MHYPKLPIFTQNVTPKALRLNEICEFPSRPGSVVFPPGGWKFGTIALGNLGIGGADPRQK